MGIAPIPTQQGKELPTRFGESPIFAGSTGRSTAAQFAPASGPQRAVAQATPQPGATESPAITPSTPQPTPTPTADLLAMFRATPPPTTRTPGQKDKASAASREATPAPRPAPSTAYRREQIPERMAGNISKRGVSSVNAVGTPLGRYEKSVYTAIGSRWYKLCDENRDRVDIGTVSVQFVVAPDGKIGNIKVISGGTSAVHKPLPSIRSRCEPEPIPEDVVDIRHLKACPVKLISPVTLVK